MRIAAIGLAISLATMVSINAAGSAEAQERELMDALQTMHRNAKEKRPRTKIKMAPLKMQPMMGDVRSHSRKMRDIGTGRQRNTKRD